MEGCVYCGQGGHSALYKCCRSKKAKKAHKIPTSSEGSSGSEEDVEWVEKKPSECLTHTSLDHTPCMTTHLT